MTSRVELKKGDRVQTTQLALDAGLFKAQQTGRFAKLGRNPGTIYVILDSTKIEMEYNKDFWESAHVEAAKK